MDAEGCADALLSLVSVHRANQLQQDLRVEALRRARSKRRAAARRVRLRALRLLARRRTALLRRARLERLQAHRLWMEGMALQFLRECSPGTPRVWSYPRPDTWWETTAPGFTDRQWLRHFRVPWATFSFLCGALRRRLKRRDTSYRLCIPLDKRVALALYKLGNACSYKTVAERFAVGVASVCHCVREFCSAVLEVLGPGLLAAPDRGALPALAERFYRAHGVPRCAGAVGRVQVPVVRPPHHQADPPAGGGGDGEGRRLVVSLQAVVDSDGQFWDVSVGDPEWACEGKAGAGLRAWASEDFPGRMQDLLGSRGSEEGVFLLADDDEPLPPQPWLLSPHRTGAEVAPDAPPACWAAREALARLRGRWQSLGRRLDCTVEVVRDMARTCCVLHNLCERSADPFLPEWIGGEDSPHGFYDEGGAQADPQAPPPPPWAAGEG